MQLSFRRWWITWCLTRNRWHAHELERIYQWEKKRLIDSDRELHERLSELVAEESQAELRVAQL